MFRIYSYAIFPCNSTHVRRTSGYSLTNVMDKYHELLRQMKNVKWKRCGHRTSSMATLRSNPSALEETVTAASFFIREPADVST